MPDKEGHVSRQSGFSTRKVVYTSYTPFDMSQEQCLDPDSVARSCVHLADQERSAWTHGLDIRSDVEAF